MKFIGFEREDEAVAWAKERMGIDGPTGFARAMSAVDDNANFVLVIVLSNFSSRNIDVHQATQPNGQGLVPKEGLKMFNYVFDYIFNNLGAARVTGLVRAKNKLARSFF